MVITSSFDCEIEEMEIDLKQSITKTITILKLTNYWPINRKQIFRGIWKIFILTSQFLFVLTQIIYTFQNLTRIQETGISLFIGIGSFSALYKMLFLYIKKTEIEQIIANMSLKEFQPKNLTQTKILQKGIFISNLLVLASAASLLTFAILFCFLPALSNWDRLPYSGWFPFDPLQPKYYAGTFVWEIVVVVNLAIGFLATDSLFFILMLQVGFQCDILCHNIINLSHNICNENLRKNVDQCIIHHQLILKYSGVSVVLVFLLKYFFKMVSSN